MNWRDWYKKKSLVNPNKEEKWNFEKFTIKCNQCQSTDILFETQAIVEQTGYCETCWGEDKYAVAFIKCRNCGSTLIVAGDDY